MKVHELSKHQPAPLPPHVVDSIIKEYIEPTLLENGFVREARRKYFRTQGAVRQEVSIHLAKGNTKDYQSFVVAVHLGDAAFYYMDDPKHKNPYRTWGVGNSSEFKSILLFGHYIIFKRRATDIERLGARLKQTLANDVAALDDVNSVSNLKSFISKNKEDKRIWHTAANRSN